MRVAVIGGGVAGLGAAYVLARAHEVEVFEREPLAGGHANTVVHDGLSLDTGFLVHNEGTYPLLIRLFRELGVATQESEMSFSVSCADCGLEYSGRRPFAQPRNAFDPRFYGLLGEIARWLRTALPALEQGDFEQASLQEYLDARGYSERFRHHFLVPLTSALWSTAPGRALEFPAATMIRFFDNHGMLGFRRLPWRTVTGGSRTYVDAIGARLGTGLRTAAEVRSLRRDSDGVDVRTADGTMHRFDQVVIATHADEALALLEDPSDAERRALGAFRYTVNETVLHTDSSVLPRARAARASWNYRMGENGAPTLTYYLNRLQQFESTTDYCVTLNQEIAPEHVLARFAYAHPLFTLETLAGQEALRALSGERRTHYAGAHLGNGFHESGLASGVAAAAAIGVSW
ncbi:MAG: FAD-dependent oxidoreductase [Actinomycetes bacterium]